MNRTKKLATYGQEFEEEEDDSGIVSKKPTAVQDQIATDEKGKRRFHGAFTGGFSAGYWNTVGSKHGWVPQEFLSSRDSRGDKIKQRAEDFMDAEDLGEYGIGNRQIKRTSTFGDQTVKRKMAWERDEMSVSTISQMFDDVVKPVSDSIGIQMLRAMGWREGRGIGLANVRQKKTRGGNGGEAQFDREQANKVAPGYELANEDVLVKHLTPLTGVHGIGYEGLRHSTVLDEKYGQTALSLKQGKHKKGIKGQAFGVGVFEEDDDSVYSNYDLSQFDFSLDVSGKGLEEASTSAKKVDATFELQPKQLNARKFYAPPRLPPNFRGEHKPIPLDVSKLPSRMKDDMKNMTALQRARFLGEDRISVMELVPSNDRRKLERRSRWDVKAENSKVVGGGEVDEERDRKQRNRVEFAEEPLKQARFKEFLSYVRRGLPFPQPTDLSVWEWESEKKEFESKLTVEERAMLPEVRNRSQPLAKTSYAAPIHEILQSKFVKEASGDLKVGRKDEDKLAAVKMEMFGDKTRQSYEWYPDNLLAKRFNVPHPYPGADVVGVPLLQKSTQRKETLMDFGLPTLGLPNTANEVEMREKRRREKEEERQYIENIGDNETEEANADKSDDSENESEDEKENVKDEKPPKSFFDNIFGDGASSDEEDDSEDDDSETERKNEAIRERRREEEMKRRREAIEKKEAELQKKADLPSTSAKKEVINIDDEDDDDVQILDDKKKNENDDKSTYGPSVPANLAETAGLTAFSVLKYLQEDLKKRRKEKESSHGKDRKKKKKSKKSKKRKDKKKRKRGDVSTSSCSSEWEEGK